MPLMARVVRYFEVVARHGSIRVAAERLNVAGSAVSRQLKQLEDELGVTLFERRATGMKLSPAGELLLRRIRLWQRDQWELMGRFGEIKGVGRSEVRVATVEALTDAILPEAMCELSRRFPQVRFRVTTGMADDIVELVRAGEVDLGVAFNPPKTAKVKFVTVVRLPLGAIMTPDHPLAANDQVNLKDCRDYPVVLAGGDMAPHSTFLNVLQATDLEVNAVAELNRMLAIKSLVRTGLGVAFLTRLDVEREIERGELVFRRLQNGGWHTTLALLVPAHYPVPAAATLLLDSLRSRFSRLTN